MKTSTRLLGFGGGLVVIFAAAAVASAAIVPASVAESWTQTSGRSGEPSAAEPMEHGREPSDHGMDHTAMPPQGVSLERDGYRLADLTAPERIGRTGRLSFRILDRQGAAVTAYTPEHTKDLHLIVVRSDGSEFRHVHPKLDDSGTWSVPWRWTTAGSYRVYADFTPADARGVTLTRNIEVAGNYRPAVPEGVSATSSVDGFQVTISGDLRAGADSALTTSVTRDGRPVTSLQPYLGAFGHLVVLRQGDLAYLHVHPKGTEPAPGQLSGPDIGFMADVPTPGRYFLYLDFRVDDEVHTARFVLDAH